MKGARRQTARSAGGDEVPGLAVRRIAADIVDGVLRQHGHSTSSSMAPAPMPASPACQSATGR